MKKLIYFLLITTLYTLSSCSVDLDEVYEDVIFNNTTFDIELNQDPKFVISPENDYTITIKAGEKLKVNTKNKTIVTAIVTPISTTDQVFGIEVTDEGYEITSFNYWVNYKITGSAKKADLTYRTSSGGTSQKTVNTPYNLAFKERFKEDFLYISAQNDDSGSLKVEVFYKDKKKASGFCSGFACIATADYTTF